MKKDWIEQVIDREENEKQCDIHVVGNHVVCDGCGDIGRGEPTLQEPDGIDCEKCSSK